MLLTICDLETTGLNPEKDSVIELGAILYSVKHAEIISQFSVLLPVMINAAEASNSIPSPITQLFKPNLNLFQEFLAVSQYISGHNFRDFDSKFFGKDFLPTLNLPVIDTMSDIKFPRGKYNQGRRRALDRLAQDHDIPVWRPHRALTDCRLIADIFSSYSPKQLSEIILAATEPRELYISLEERPGTLSKAAGFSWNTIVPKRWAASLTKSEVQSLSFNVVKAVPTNKA